MQTLTTPPQSGLFRTSTNVAAPVRVDRTARVIFGASLMQVGNLGEGDSRNWTVTQDSLQQAYTFATRGNNGLKARFTHPNMSSDGMGSYLGRWKNFKLDNGTLRADLHIADAAFKSPQGDLGTYIMDMAENEPDMFGVSLATELDMNNLMEFENKSETSGSLERWPMKFTAIRAGDVVDEPAATRGGMFDLSEPDLRNLPAQATALLSTYFGDACPAVVRARIDGFLTKYFANQGASMPDAATPSATEAELETMPGDTVPAEDTAAIQDHIDPVAEPDGVPQPQVEKFGTEDLGEYMQTFGDAEGARMFRDKIPFQTALLQHLKSVKGVNQDLSAELAQVKSAYAGLLKENAGEKTPLNLSGEGSHKSLSEAFRANKPTR